MTTTFSTARRPKVWIWVLCAALALLGLAVVVAVSKDTVTQGIEGEVLRIEPPPPPGGVLQGESPARGVNAKPSQDPRNVSMADELLLDAMLIQEMLESIPRQSDNSLVINGETRRLLDAAVMLIGEGRSSAELEGLLTIIRASLPGQSSELVARTLGQYYEYKEIEQDFLAAQTVHTEVDFHRQYQDLKQLRSAYLGEEMAEQLFEEEYALLEYSLAVQAIYDNTELSPAQRQEALDALEESSPLREN